MRQTTESDIYTALVELIEKVTGRPAWTKAGLLNIPNVPYSVVFMAAGSGPTMDQVERTILEEPLSTGEAFLERPWGSTTFEVAVDFFKNSSETSAQSDAMKFRASLLLSERYNDIWQICGFSGPVKYLDISAAFSADTEPRARVTFSLNALIDTGVSGLHEIAKQEIHITGQYGERTVTIDKDELSATISGG